MAVNEKLVFLRKQHGMTQVELAERLGISRQTVSKWECGTVFPSSENLVSIGKLFSISVDNLLDENVQFRAGTAVAVVEAETAPEEETERENTEPENTEPENTEPENTEGAGKFRAQKRINIVFAVCILLTAVISAAAIYLAVSSKPQDNPIRLDDITPEYIDLSKAVDDNDGWITIKE